MSKNDDRIIELKKQIELKKKELSSKRIKFVPETNCMLTLDEKRYNLNVCTDDELMLLLVKLNMYILSAKDLGMANPTFSGYSVDAWISDIKNKLVVSGARRLEQELKAKEAQLELLLSEDKKTELMLDEIAAFLDN